MALSVTTADNTKFTIDVATKGKDKTLVVETFHPDGSVKEMKRYNFFAHELEELVLLLAQ